MRSRIGRAGRLGKRFNKRETPHWSPASVPGLEGWWSADDALASVGPDVAARPGDRVRSVKDSSKHRRDMEQTTANRQPMLGYLRPPKGNMVWWSEPVYTGNAATGWAVLEAGGMIVAEEGPLGPNGEGTTRFTNNNPTTHGWLGVRCDTRLGLMRFQCSIRTVSGSINTLFRFGGIGDMEPVSIGDEWVVMDGTTTIPVESAGERNLLIRLDPGADVYVGRVWGGMYTWSDEYVETTGTPVIPDTTGLQRAMVFDGVVGNFLETTPNQLGNAPDITIITVHGVESSGPSNSQRLLSGANRLTNTSDVRVLSSGDRQLTRWSSYDVTAGPIEPRRAYLDTIYQQPDGTVVFRNSGQEYGSIAQSPVETYPPNTYRLGLERPNLPNSFANGPITDVLYYTRALSDEEIQRVEDYFLIKSGINRIVTEESEVKELETVKALAPGIWYLDGAPITEEPTQEITVPFGAAGKELTVGDSYGIEVQAASYLEFDANKGVWADLARTIPAEIGEPVAAWDSVGTLGVTVSNSTANQQPRLGYADCYGNLLRSSDDLTNADEWFVYGIGEGITGYPGPEPGKWGEQTIIVGPEDPEVVPPTGHAGIRQDSIVLEEGESYVFQVSARLVEEVQHTQRMQVRGLPGVNPSFILTSTEWGTYTSGPFTATGSSGTLQIRTSNSRTEEEAHTYWEIGRVTLRKASWTPAHVVTHDAPVIPDESNKELAVVFDGVNDLLLLSQPSIQTPTDMTIFSVYGWEPVTDESGERQGVFGWASPGGVLLETRISGASYQAHNTNFGDNSGDIPVNYLQNNYKFTTVWDLQVSTEIFPKYARVFESTGTSNGTFLQATPSNMRVGRMGGYGTLNGGISRIILFDKRLSEAQRTEIRNHLYGVYRNTIALTDPVTLTANTEVFWSVNHDLVAQTPSLTFDISGLASGDEVRGGNSEPYIIP